MPRIRVKAGTKYHKKKETSTNDGSEENVIDDIDSSSANISIFWKEIEHINVHYVIMKISIKLSKCHAKKKGLASLLHIEYSWGLYHELYPSQTTGHNSYDVNKGIVYTIRATDQGYAGIEIFKEHAKANDQKHL